MAEPPPPPSPTPKQQPKVKDKSSRLPPTSRFPVLVSGQVSFTTAAAIRDIEQVPTNVYRVQVELQPRTSDKTFKEAPWTLVARHFLSTIQLYDDTAIIIRKKENTVANKISSPEELPENPDDFERDYAYDVKLRSERSVTFKILIGTKLPYWRTFREGPLYNKLVDNDWYVKYVRLENQGTVAAIGHLLFAHNRYVNQEDVIIELKELIHPVKCEQIDIRVTKSKEFYYEGNKKMRVFTKWLTIDCPMDIATKLSNLLMERWKTLQTDPKFKDFNLKNTVYVPRNKGLVNFNARIENIAKQNEFLRNYRDVTVLRNVNNIDATFRYSEDMGKIFDDQTKVGQRLKLKEFLRTWEDNSTGKPAIIAINRTNRECEYSLLSGMENMNPIHEKINLFIDELSTQMGFTEIMVGGTKGVTSKMKHSEMVTSYANENFNTQRTFQQKPQQEDNNNKEEQQQRQKQKEQNNWKSPPTTNWKQKKGTKPSLTINYNDERLIQQYSDVVVGNSYSNNNNGTYTGKTMEPNKGNHIGKAITATANNTVTRHEGHQIGSITTVKEKDMNNSMSIQSILESTLFRETLAKAVAPQVSKQVSSLVAPTLEKITHIESQVEELNDNVKGNTSWQDNQTNRQNELQQSINQMQMTMNSMISLFKDDKEKESGVKRSAPTITQTPMKSPRRIKNKNLTPFMSSTPVEGSKMFDYETYDDEASNQTHTNLNTQTDESADEAMMPRDTNGEGAEQ